MTLDFYERNGAKFAAQTQPLDMSGFYKPFLAQMRAHGHILDAGCGSGRDTKAFLERGYQVTAFDASQTLVNIASAYPGLPVRKMTFQEMAFHNEFDGVWACASLLHIPLDELAGVLVRCANALKSGGVLYLSFKYGDGQRIAEDGRQFTDMNEARLTRLLQSDKSLALDTVWTNADSRPGRNEVWLNAIARKVANTPLGR